MRYRKYDNKDRPAEVDLVVDTPRQLPLWRVTCRRSKGSPGQLQVEVRAASADAAAELVRTGQVPGIGLGWKPFITEAMSEEVPE
jgi:hypothetical protein